MVASGRYPQTTATKSCKSPLNGNSACWLTCLPNSKRINMSQNTATVSASPSERIEARFIHGSDRDSFCGLFDCRCPICDGREVETDLCRQFEEGSGRTVELCESCIGDFERETEAKIDSDVLNGELFHRLWAWTTENLSQNRKRAMRRN